MRCWKCGFEFGEGIFCPECGTKYEFEKVKIENKNKTNILLTHCDLNGAKDKNGFSYNTILECPLEYNY